MLKTWELRIIALGFSIIIAFGIIVDATVRFITTAPTHVEITHVINVPPATADPVDDDSQNVPQTISDAQRKQAANHEAGHAVVAYTLRPDSLERVEVYKSTYIVTDGHSLGMTKMTPGENKTRTDVRDLIAVTYGGYAADELFYGEPLSGSESDLKKGTQKAIAFVQTSGLAGGPTFTPLSYKTLDDHFLLTDPTRAKLELEITALLAEGYERARKIVADRQPFLNALTDQLVQDSIVYKGGIDELDTRYPCVQPCDY